MNKKEILYGLLLGAGGFLLNWFKLELFFNVDFLFGSILAMFALMRFGLVTGAIAAVIASCCSWHHWHHPWAIIIFTAETLFTGYFYQKRKMDAVVANLLYWFSLGLLLILLFYQLVMGLPFLSALLIGLKQGINGISNTLVASALYIGYRYTYGQHEQPPSLRQLIFVTISLFVVVPAFLFLYLDIRRTLSNQLEEHRAKTILSASSAQKSVSLWFHNIQGIVRYLAVTSSPPGKNPDLTMQHHLDIIRSSIPELNRVGLLDAGAITRAFSPYMDENGLSTIGLDLSDRPYIQAVKAKPDAMVTQIFTGKIGNPGPRLVFVAPVPSRSGFNGAALGIAELGALQQLLQRSVDANSMNMTLVDNQGRVVVSTRKNLKPLDAFVLPANGTLMPLSNGISHWIPDAQPGVAASKRWMSSFYLKDLPLEDNPGWNIVVEASLKPTLTTIGKQTSQALAGIGMLLLLMIYLSRFFSGKLATTVSDFEKVTRLLPAKIAAGATIAFPTPATSEMLGLTNTVRQMSETLRHSHYEQQQLNETLEQRVRERSIELEIERQRLANIIYATNVGTWEWNIQTGEITFNERWAQIIGYQLSELKPIGIHTWRDRINPEEADLYRQALSLHFSGQEQYFNMEYRMQHRWGHWVWVLDRGKIVSFDDQGEPLIMSGTHQDITEWKVIEDSLFRHQKQLEMLNETLEKRVQDEVRKNREKDRLLLQKEKLASIGQLAAGVAHEINNPMAFIISNLNTFKGYFVAINTYMAAMEVFLESGQGDGHQRAELDALRSKLDLSYIMDDTLPLILESEEGAERVKQIVQALKDFARSDEHFLQEVDLNQCIQSTINIVKSELKYVADLNLQLASVPPIQCNPQQINQVIANLLINAAHSIKESGTISISTSHEQDQVIMAISDTGHGIAPEIMDRIFDPFFTTKGIGEGTGLGLSISYEIIRKHHGEIKVESAPGEGTVFTVSLPMRQPESRSLLSNSAV